MVTSAGDRQGRERQGMHTAPHLRTWNSLPPAATSRAVLVSGSFTRTRLATTPCTCWKSSMHWKAGPEQGSHGQSHFVKGPTTLHLHLLQCCS